MKILILGLPRSGTTSLVKGIQKQKYHAIIEPFNGGLQNAVEREYPLDDFDVHNNLVVKSIINQKPISYSGHWHDFNLEFIPLFDKLIFLDRRDFDSHYSSVVNLWYRISRDETTMQAWTDEDVPLDFIKGYELGGGKDKLYKEKESFRQLLSKIGQSDNIIYYEDLYGPDRDKSLQIINDLNLKDIDSIKLNEYLDPSNKLYRSERRAVI